MWLAGTNLSLPDECSEKRSKQYVNKPWTTESSPYAPPIKHATVNVHLVLILYQAPARLEIGLHHFLNERVKIDLPLPTEYPLSFGRPTQELSTCSRVEFNAQR